MLEEKSVLDEVVVWFLMWFYNKLTPEQRGSLRCHEVARLLFKIFQVKLGVAGVVKDGTATYQKKTVVNFAKQMPDNVDGESNLLETMDDNLEVLHSWLEVDGWVVDFHPWMQVERTNKVHIRGFLFIRPIEETVESHRADANTIVGEDGTTVIFFPGALPSQAQVRVHDLTEISIPA